MSKRHCSMRSAVSGQTSKTRPLDSNATPKRQSRSNSSNKPRKYTEASLAADETTCLSNIDALLIEDDVFYRTVRTHPSWPELDPEVLVTLIRPSELAETDVGGSGGGGKMIGWAGERDWWKKSLSVEKRSTRTMSGLGGMVDCVSPTTTTTRVKSTNGRWKSMSSVPFFLIGRSVSLCL